LKRKSRAWAAPFTDGQAGAPGSGPARARPFASKPKRRKQSAIARKRECHLQSTLNKPGPEPSAPGIGRRHVSLREAADRLQPARFFVLVLLLSVVLTSGCRLIK